MRLFGKVDGVVDRFDRAGWLTMPFDMAFSSLVYGPLIVGACDFSIPGALDADIFVGTAVCDATPHGVQDVDIELP